MDNNDTYRVFEVFRPLRAALYRGQLSAASQSKSDCAEEITVEFNFPILIFADNYHGCHL